MTPDELRTKLLHGERNDEFLNGLPRDAYGLVGGWRPDHNESAKTGRYIRRFLIGAAAIYAFFYQHSASDIIGALGFIVMYEFAYGNAAKVRADLEDMQDRERYRIRVDEFLKEKFPGYVPPDDGFTLFDVSPHAK